jgi:hypothetical protein
MTPQAGKQGNPFLIGQIALQEGLVSPERLEECVRLQSSEARGLGEILVSKGYLTRPQLAQLFEIQKRQFDLVEADPSRGGLFGQIALRLGYITRERLNECLREQQALARGGSSLLLGQLLLKKQYLTPDRFLEILRRQKKDVTRCPGCDRFYDVKDRPSGAKFVCAQCGTVIP